MSALLLMGCSSGALSDEGNFEPRGIPVELLARGAPTVISMLWDITDRDIDRLTLSLLEQLIGTVKLYVMLHKLLQTEFVYTKMHLFIKH